MLFEYVHLFYIVKIRILISRTPPEDPLVSEIAKMFTKDREKHDQTAKEWTKKYAQIT